MQCADLKIKTQKEHWPRYGKVGFNPEPCDIVTRDKSKAVSVLALLAWPWNWFPVTDEMTNLVTTFEMKMQLLDTSPYGDCPLTMTALALTMYFHDIKTDNLNGPANPETQNKTDAVMWRALGEARTLDKNQLQTVRANRWCPSMHWMTFLKN